VQRRLQGLGLPATSQETEVDLGNRTMNLHEKAPLFPVLKSERAGTQKSHLNIRVLESTDKHLMGSFSTPDFRALTFDIIPGRHDSILQSPTMNFQVVFYAICKEPSKSGSRGPGTTGQLYNDGPYIQSQVVSVSDLIIYKLTQANMSSFVLYLKIAFLKPGSLRVSGHVSSSLQVAILSCRVSTGLTNVTCFKGCFFSLAWFFAI
jgi:hypothetical protein